MCLSKFLQLEVAIDEFINSSSVLWGGEGGEGAGEGVREGGRGDTNFSEFVEEEEGDHGGGCESGAEGDICEDGERLGREGVGVCPLTVHDVVGESSHQSSMRCPLGEVYGKRASS